MKSGSLVSTTERYVRTRIERSVDSGERDVRRVEALDAIEGDRKRSLRQELREADPQQRELIGISNGPEARDVVGQVAALPPAERARLTRPPTPDGLAVVDEKV